MENRFSRNPHNRHQEHGYRFVLSFCLFTSINQINEVFVTSDQIFFLTPTQISRNVYFKDIYFQFNEWLFYNIYVLFAEHLKWFASVRIILDFTSHNWELNVRRDFFSFLHTCILFIFIQKYYEVIVDCIVKR